MAACGEKRKPVYGSNKGILLYNRKEFLNN
jgi:hypothetical protein